MNNDARTVVRALLIDHGDPTRSLDWTRRLAQEYCRSRPGWRIQIDGAAFPDMARALIKAVRDGRPPAIAQLSYTTLQVARDLLGAGGQPLFAPAGPAIGGRSVIAGEPVTSGGIIPAVLDHYTCDGELWAIPTQASTIVTFANMSMLAAAGIGEIPRTWQQVDTACTALRGMRGGPRYAITWPNYSWWPQHAVGAQGGLLADHDNGRSGRAERMLLASDQMLAYLHWWRRLHSGGHYLYTSRPTVQDPIRIWGENFRALASGDVALCVTTSVFGGRLAQAAREAGFELGVARAPYNGEVAYHGSVIGGDALWLAAGLDPDARDVALGFMEHLNTARNAADRHKVMAYEPITVASAELLEAEGWFDQRPHQRGAYDELTGARGSAHAKAAVIGDFAAIREVIVDATHDVLAGGADPTERFTAANATAQALLDKYNAHVALGQGPPGLDVD